MSKKPHFGELQLTVSGRQRELLLLAVESLDEQFENEDFEDHGFSPEEARTMLSGLRDAFLSGIWIELTRAVADDEGDFDDTRNYEFSKKEIYESVAQELEWAREAGYLKVPQKTIPKLARKFKWENDPKFLEFDSGRDHACGYWELRIQGPAELEEALADYQQAV